MDILYLATSSQPTPELTEANNRRGWPFGWICLAWLVRRMQLQPMLRSPRLRLALRSMHSASRFALQTGASVFIPRVVSQSGGMNAPDAQFCELVSAALSSQVESRTATVNQAGNGVSCRARTVCLASPLAREARSAESRTCSI